MTKCKSCGHECHCGCDCDECVNDVCAGLYVVAILVFYMIIAS